MDVQTTTFGPKTYLVWTKAVPMSEMNNRAMWDAAYKMTSEYIGNNSLSHTPVGIGLYLDWDTEKGMTTVGIGFEVQGIETVDHEELSLVVVPESEAMHVVHEGDYEGLGKAHQAMMEAAKEKDAVFGLAVEEYVVDPLHTTKPEEWKTNVWHVVTTPDVTRKAS